VLEHLFTNIAEQACNSVNNVVFACTCSFYEIYNEKVYDLLEDSVTKADLNVREDKNKHVFVENLREQTVTCCEAVQDLLAKGYSNRQVAETAM
jgi:kinesin family protein 15